MTCRNHILNAACEALFGLTFFRVFFYGQRRIRMCDFEFFENDYWIFCHSSIFWLHFVIAEFGGIIQMNKLWPKQRVPDLHSVWTSRLLMTIKTIDTVSFLFFFFFFFLTGGLGDKKQSLFSRRALFFKEGVALGSERRSSFEKSERWLDITWNPYRRRFLPVRVFFSILRLAVALLLRLAVHSKSKKKWWGRSGLNFNWKKKAGEMIVICSASSERSVARNR